MSTSTINILHTVLLECCHSDRSEPSLKGVKLVKGLECGIPANWHERILWLGNITLQASKETPALAKHSGI